MEVSKFLRLGITLILSHQVSISSNTIITVSESKGRMGIKCRHKALMYFVKIPFFWQHEKILTLACH